MLKVNSILSELLLYYSTAIYIKCSINEKKVISSNKSYKCYLKKSFFFILHFVLFWYFITAPNKI